MPISGTDRALMYAIGGTMRGGASRGGYLPGTAFVTFDGVTRRNDARKADLRISDALNHTANRCFLTVDGAAPTKGDEVIIRLGSPLRLTPIFAGHALTTTQVAELEVPAHKAWKLDCEDYTWNFNSRKVTARYVAGTAISTIASVLIATYAPGFSSAAIASGLGTLAEDLTFTDADLADCFTELVRRGGLGGWKVDYNKVVHLFITSTLQAPTTLTLSHDSLTGFTFTEDLSNVITRALGYGGGSSTLVGRLLSDTIIPVEDATWYLDAGGIVVSGPQYITYTGRHLGGVAAIVPTGASSVAAPGSAPNVALSATAGRLTAGNHQWKVNFESAAGVTLLGPASSIITALDFLPPSSMSLVGAVSGALGPLIGTHNYKVTFVTARGETTMGPSVGRTAVAVAAPGALTTTEVSSTIGVLIGTFNYKVTFLTLLGETLGGTLAAQTVAAQSAPSAPTIGTHTVAGPLIGTYSYKIGNVSAIGETIGTATSSTSPVATVADAPTVTGDGTGQEIAYAVTYVHPIFGESALSSRTVDTNKGTNPVVTVVNLPSGCGWNVYSTGTVAGGTGGTAALFKVAQMGVGVASFTHVNQTGPAEGVVASLGKNIPLTSIPTGPTGTLARRIYRTKAGGSQYFLVSVLADNSTTTFTDNVPDSALTTSAPLENLNGKQIALSSIPTGTAGVVLGRRIYRTTAGGSTYKLLAELADNSTTTLTDNTPDIDLGPDTIPLVSTAGGEQNLLHTFLPTGATGTVARRIYRTVAGGSEYRLVGQINDNTTTSFTDNVADSALGDYAPSVNTAGSSQVDLTSIPVGTVGVVRRNIFRTKAGGSEYFYLGSLNDNVTTVFTDSVADESLGELAPVVATAITATGGALIGATSLVLSDASGFPSAGWFEADSQRISYTGKSTNTLTGIPAIKMVLNITRSGSVATVTVNAHGFQTGQKVTIIGATQPEYNGTFTITVTGTNTFTYAVQGTPATPGITQSTVSTAPSPALTGTSLVVATGTGASFPATPFNATIWPAAVDATPANSEVVRVTARATDTLTIVRAQENSTARTVVAGDRIITTSSAAIEGSMRAAIAGGSVVVTLPLLTGVSGILYDIKEGDTLTIFRQVDDAAAQAALATLIGGSYDGIREDTVSDGALTHPELQARCEALLDQKKDARAEVRYRTRDVTTQSGATITVNLGSPTNVSGTFMIQQVTISEFQKSAARGGDSQPTFDVVASTERFSLEDLLRRRRAA